MNEEVSGYYITGCLITSNYVPVLFSRIAAKKTTHVSKTGLMNHEHVKATQF